ncbi:MAG: hypothetical protein WDO70_09530 [Alphaproteobacteria bacterium]
MTPQLIDPKKSPYNPSNWDKDSANKLHAAKVYVGIVSDRNPLVHYDKPRNADNSIEAYAWGRAVEAAIDAADGTRLDLRVTNFFLRQEGEGRQTPPWLGLTRYLSLGPFNNAGGGDVPEGLNTYIDFYGK